MRGRKRAYLPATERAFPQQLTNLPGPVLNVCDPRFGATGDGATDDRAAFAACDSAADDAGGLAFAPPGTYYISSSITLSANWWTVPGVTFNNVTPTFVARYELGLGTGGAVDHGSLAGLGDDDHTQYLRVDGTRSLTGNLSVSAGVTIDGVDISAHAADGDIHADHTTISITAGSGLTGGGTIAANRTLNVGAGDGIDVAADSVSVDVTDLIGNGLTESSNNIVVGAGAGITVNANDVALTTPGTLSVSSGNSATGNHTHAITASAAPGTAAALLKTTAAGLLSLQTFELTGGAIQADNYAADTTGWRIAYNGTAEFNTSLEVTGPATIHGALDVDGSNDVTFSNGFVYDGSAQSVGIGGNPGIATWPDPQFTLDINGNVRWWGWGVGKMALQIEGALLISHFDGAEPYETDFTGMAIGHRGQAPVESGTLVYRPGKFLKALQFAPAITNEINNPAFENNVTDSWTFSQDGTGGSAIWANARAYIGSRSGALTASSTGNAQLASNTFTLPAGETAQVRVRLWRNSAVGSNAVLYDVSNTTGRLTLTPADTAAWESLSGSWTNNTGSDVTMRVLLRNTEGDGASAVWFDAVQAAIGDFQVPFVYGAMPGVSWAGTAHNSASSSTASQLRYETSGNLYAGQGTVMAWAYKEANTGANQYVMLASGTSAGFILLRSGGGGSTQAVWGTSTLTGDAWSPGEWVHVAMTYDGSTLRLYQNGEETASAAASGFSGMPTYLNVGDSGGTSHINGLVDDFVILDRAADADEIRAIYESDAPLFAETSTWSWADPTLSIRVDDTGLFARSNDSDAEAVFAVATQAVTWGTHSLGVGDVLMGNSTSVVWWDKSAGSLTVGDPAGGRLTIDPTNGVRLIDDGGSAVISLPTSGNAEIVGTLDITGTANAGGGAVQITGNGITIEQGDNDVNKLAWDNFTHANFASFIYGSELGSAGSEYPYIEAIARNPSESGSGDAEARLTASVGASGANIGIAAKATSTTAGTVTITGTTTIGGDTSITGSLAVRDELNLKAMSAPGTPASGGVLYVDSSDGDLKVKFSNGTTKTIATN